MLNALEVWEVHLVVSAIIWANSGELSPFLSFIDTEAT